MDENDRMRQLAQALLALPDDAACAACLDLLEEYVAGQATGTDYAGRWPEVARHLDSCVACAQAYGLLYELRLAEPAGLPTSIPRPDLSFLQAGPAKPLAPGAQRAIQLGAALASAVERAGARLRLAFSQQLLDLLPPPAGPALAFRDAGQQEAPLFELALDEPGAVVERLQVSAYAAATERCAVRVQLALRGREWPDLAGVPVTLALNDERRQAATDEWGEAVFDDLPAAALPNLRIEVDGGAQAG